MVIPMRSFTSLRALSIVALVTLLLAGCKQKPTPTAVEDKRYDQPLGPGEMALRRLLPTDPQPDLASAFNNKDAFISMSADQSLKWFRTPSSQRYFPFHDFTHEQAAGSVLAMKELLETSATAEEFEAAMKDKFEFWFSKGYNGEGIVLFTGYYSPEFNASPERTDRFTFPLYKRPADLATDSMTGEPLGRRAPDGSTSPYPTRLEIEESGMLAGSELVWMEDALDAYVVHVNGSAKLRMPDGRIQFVGYSGKTDREYIGLGESMVKEGHIPAAKLSLPAIRDFYEKDPQTVIDLINRNESYVFFTLYDGSNWPAGSLGVKVTEQSTLATDKKVYPRGGPLMVATRTVTMSSGSRDFDRFMFDQDTGGAIRAAGRADIYMGIGPAAEILAGGQYAEGYLYYFFLKPEYISEYAPRALTKPGRSVQ